MLRHLSFATLAVLIVAGRCLAQTEPSYEVVALAGTNGPGAQPFGGVVLGPDGNYYGTASTGGAYGGGTVFKLTPDGNLTQLVSFLFEDGNPQAGLIVGSDGNLYGTSNGNPSEPDGNATIFRVTPAGQLTTLATFPRAAPPAQNQSILPNKLVQGSDGHFYGTTYRGGAHEKGSIFKLTADGTITTLVSFEGPNGANPRAGLVQGSDGNFYGTTDVGGNVNNGTAFRMTPAGALTMLYSFGHSSPVGGFPRTELLEAAPGIFYGVTSSGGANFGGVAFKMTAEGSVTALASLPSHPFAASTPLLLGNDGNFYGTTSGHFYRVTPAGELTLLVNFEASFNGRRPAGPLLKLANGDFLGTTSSGGTTNVNAYGLVHRLTVAGEAIPFVIFPKIVGRYFNSEVTEASDGFLYGTSSDDGAGSVSSPGMPGAFKLSPSGAISSLGRFLTFSQSPGTASRLVEAQNGELYGAIAEGGLSGSPPPSGFIYRTTSSGSLSTVFQFRSDGFSPNQNGARPVGGLTRGPDGALYGTTAAGGAQGAGTFFKIDAARVLTTLASFNAATGAGPDVDLIFADGIFYGLTAYGGANNKGTLFSVSLSGQITQVASMPADFIRPYGGRLILARDGNFYGATAAGGVNNLGTIFRLTKTGVLSTVGSMDSTTGAAPIGVIEAKDGNFYGVTRGSSQEDGGIFRLTPEGVVTPLFRFSTERGFYPEANLMEASDGHLYGTTRHGGPARRGVVYRVRVAQLPFKLTSIERLANGHVHIQGLGAPLTAHSLEATGELLLQPFAAIGQAMADSEGRFSFIDTNAASFSRRFYRAVRLPVAPLAADPKRIQR
jgi:uncharacterized repeat protein (TIGR03803 family)